MTDTISFRDTMLSASPKTQASMKKRIEASLERRHAFETHDGQHAAGSSWVKSREAIEKSIVAVAQLFIALGLDPKNVFERQVVEGRMLNAKSLKKIVELAQFAAGTRSKMETVIEAFLACALIAADKLGPDTVFSNAVNARFLNTSDLTGYIKDRDLLDAMKERRHKSMTTGALTQSSQMRNVLDVLGLGTITKMDRSRDAICINAGHPFFDQFRSTYMA